jgi:lysophospholipase L1-like esterase
VAGSASLSQADGIHPTSEGYRIIADKCWKRQKPLLNGRK